MADCYEIAIVGGGFVGYTLALSLAHHPIHILLIEGKSQASICVDVRSIVLSQGSQHSLQEFGLWNELHAYTTSIQKTHISDAGHFGMLELSAAEEGLAALGYVIQGQILLEKLAIQVKSRPNIHLLQPATLQSLEKTREGWCCQVALSPHETKTIKASFLVGADGAHSTVRKLLGIEATTRDYHQVAIASLVHLNRSHHQVAYERFIPGGSIAFLPREELTAGVVLSVPEREAASFQLSDQEFLNKIQSLFGYRLGRFIKVMPRVSFPLRLLKTQQQVGEGWVLMGNAAHVLHPIAAQGFNLGLRDIHAFVDMIGSAPDWSRLNLGDYEKQRKPDQDQTIKLTHQLIDLFMPDRWPLTVSRNLATVVMNNTFLKRRLIAQTTK